MTYEQRLDFLFNGRPECNDFKRTLLYETLLDNRNRHNERLVMKLCVLKLKDNPNAKGKHFTIKTN